MLFLIPFFHTGIKANYLIGKFNLMAGLVNPTDFKSAFQELQIAMDTLLAIKTNSLFGKLVILEIN
jgi:hypothetical protein